MNCTVCIAQWHCAAIAANFSLLVKALPNQPRYPGSLLTVSNLSLSRFAGHIGLTALANYLSNIRTQIVGIGKTLIQNRDVPSQCTVKEKLILDKKGLNRLFVPPEFRIVLLNEFHC